MDKGDASTVTGHPSPLTTYALRLGPGEEIVTSLQYLVEKQNLQAAFILTCVGSVTTATLRMANSLTITKYQGPFEIVSLVGTLSAGGHLHASFSNKEGHVIGGHVVGDLYVYTTAEIVVGECSALKFTREHDERSGYKELLVGNRG